MQEVATSVMNKNSLLYGTDINTKNIGPSCVERKGEEVKDTPANPPVDTPNIAVREK